MRAALEVALAGAPPPGDDGLRARLWLAPQDMVAAGLRAGAAVSVSSDAADPAADGAGVAAADAWPCPKLARGKGAASDALLDALGGDCASLAVRPLELPRGEARAVSLFPADDAARAALAGPRAAAAVAALAAARLAGRALAPGGRVALPLAGRPARFAVAAVGGSGPPWPPRVLSNDVVVSIVTDGDPGDASGDESDGDRRGALPAGPAAAAAALAAALAVGGGLSGPAARAAARAAAAGEAATANRGAHPAGAAAAAARLADLVALPLARPDLYASYGLTPPAGVLLHGPPGTGKTLLAGATAATARVALFAVGGPDLVAAAAGGSEAGLRGVFAAAAAAAPAIVFLDEIDALAPAPGGGSAGASSAAAAASGGAPPPSSGGGPAAGAAARLVAALAAELDACPSRRVAVVAATNRPDAVHPALRRPGRLDAEVEVVAPTPAGRAAILRAHLAGVAHALPPASIDALADAAHGFVGADLALLVREACLAALRRLVRGEGARGGDRDPSTSTPPRVTEADFASARRAVRPSAMRAMALRLPPATWDDVGGQAGVKARLAEALGGAGAGAAAAAALAAVGAAPPAGVLLYGPPGCSKTLLARAAAAESGRNFFGVKAGELLSAWVGDAEKAVASLFAAARAAAPAVVFFDEIDGLAPARAGAGGGAGGGGVDARVLSQLLIELDALTRPAAPSILVLAATNRPDRVDAALLRPGRFDRRLHVRAPASAGERAAVLAAATRCTPLSPDVDLSALADATPGFTGADLAALARGAALAAAEEGEEGADAVAARHFASALAGATPSPPVPADLQAAYASFERAGFGG